MTIKLGKIIEFNPNKDNLVLYDGKYVRSLKLCYKATIQSNEIVIGLAHFHNAMPTTMATNYLPEPKHHNNVKN